MLVFRIALRNLSRRGRKTTVVALLISVGVAAFFLGNAVLESSIGGIKSTFSDNLTADLSVSEHSDQSFSVFGPDVPIIGDYESEPSLVNAAAVGQRIAQVPGVTATAYLLSSPLLLEINGAKSPGLGLGVIGDEYFSFFRAPRFIAGAPPAANQSGWVVITEDWAVEIGAALGRPLAVGDTLQLSLFRNQTFTIRTAVLIGIIRYQPASEALRHVVITDGRIIRALCGFSQTDVAGTDVRPKGIGGTKAGSDDIDSLFSAGSSSPSLGHDSEGPLNVEELRSLLSEAHRQGQEAQEAGLDHTGAWHFILVRAAPGASVRAVGAELRRGLAASGFLVQVRDWRGTAGGIATYVFLLQIVLYIGMFMLGSIAVILTVNSVVMSVFERTSEIGTMRAVGAQKDFVRRLLAIETCTLTLFSGIVGILLGSAAVGLLNTVPLHIRNELLILLFGGTTLHPSISATNIALSAAAAVLIGIVAWVYPVGIALRIRPVRAIHAP